MSDFTLKDIQQLDEVSYDEVDKILEKYEDLRGVIEYRLGKIGRLDDARTYELYDSIMMDASQSRDIRKRRAIAAQIREENLSDNRRSESE